MSKRVTKHSGASEPRNIPPDSVTEENLLKEETGKLDRSYYKTKRTELQRVGKIAGTVEGID